MICSSNEESEFANTSNGSQKYTVNYLAQRSSLTEKRHVIYLSIIVRIDHDDFLKIIHHLRC